MNINHHHSVHWSRILNPKLSYLTGYKGTSDQNKERIRNIISDKKKKRCKIFASSSQRDKKKIPIAEADMKRKRN